MKDKMIEIPHLEWHITHNCNLTCQGCMHFTNHGHNWFVSIEELRNWYSKWNSRISPKSISILGGEPLLHKDLVDIIYLTKEMWTQPKNSYFEVVTNALLLDEKTNEDLPKALSQTNCILSVSIHSTPKNEKYADKLNKSFEILDRWQETYGITIFKNDMYNNWYMAYKGYGINSEPFEDNDPEQSWNNCRAGQKCFQLYESNIYKCCMTAYLQLQKDKYGDLLSKKWDPYLKYIPLYPDCTDKEIIEFFNRKAEPVCGMCPKKSSIDTKEFGKNDPLIPVSFYDKKNNNKFDYFYN